MANGLLVLFLDECIADKIRHRNKTENISQINIQAIKNEMRTGIQYSPRLFSNPLPFTA